MLSVKRRALYAELELRLPLILNGNAGEQREQGAKERAERCYENLQGYGSPFRED